MKFEIVSNGFSIVFSLLVYYVTPYPQASTEYDDIVKKCLRKINCSEKDVFNTEGSAFKDFKLEIIKELHMAYRNEQNLREKAYQNEAAKNRTKTELEIAQNEIRSERDLRLYYQSLLDIKDNIKNLFDKCWPAWASISKPTKTYDEYHYKILLLNIEDTRIFNLKKQLAVSKISEKHFIEKAMVHVKIRNEEAHPKMTLEEKDEAYSHLNKKFPYMDSSLLYIMLFHLEFWFDSTTKQDLDEAVETIVTAETQSQRQTFNLVIIPNFRAPRDKENKLKEIFEVFANRHDAERNGTEIKPIVVGVTSGGAYVLFKDFEGAYFFWTRRRRFSFVDSEYDNIVIVEPNDPRIGISTKNEWYIKIVATEKEICNEIDGIINELRIDYSRITPKIFRSSMSWNRNTQSTKLITLLAETMTTSAKSITVSEKSTTIPTYAPTFKSSPSPLLHVYYGFSNLENLLKTYQYCKSKIPSGDGKITLAGSFKSNIKDNLVEFECNQ